MAIEKYSKSLILVKFSTYGDCIYMHEEINKFDQKNDVSNSVTGTKIQLSATSTFSLNFTLTLAFEPNTF